MDFNINAWIPSICIFVGLIALRICYDKFLYNWLYLLTDYTETEYDDYVLAALKEPLYFLIVVLAFYEAIVFAPIATHEYSSIFIKILRCSLIIGISWTLVRFFSRQNGFLKKFFEDIGFAYSEIGVNICSPVLRFMAVILAAVLIGKEWDYDITVFFASLSLGSLAIAFAAKDTLANVFGSMVLVIDKPLSIGEWVLVNGIEGIVENISFRSTSIRKFSQELVYIPNSVLTNTPIINFSRMQKRRIDFTFNLDYINDPDNLEAAMQEMREWLTARPYSLSDASVEFISYGEFAATIRVIVYISVVEFYEWLKTRSDVNLGILKIAKKHNINIAVPARRHLE